MIAKRKEHILEDFGRLSYIEINWLFKISLVDDDFLPSKNSQLNNKKHGASQLTVFFSWWFFTDSIFTGFITMSCKNHLGEYVSFSPLLGEDFQFDSYFSDGLVQPAPGWCILSTLSKIQVKHHDSVHPVALSTAETHQSYQGRPWPTWSMPPSMPAPSACCDGSSRSLRLERGGGWSR